MKRQIGGAQFYGFGWSGDRRFVTLCRCICELIVPQEQPVVQLAALKILALIPDLTVTNYVLKQWDALTPDVRGTLQ